MNQMQSFIEKAKNDSALMAKLDALGASGAEPDKIVALAAEYGFSITEADYLAAREQAGAQKSGELMEEDLEAAAGGGTQNRYDPQRCGNTTRTSYECVGLFLMTWCDHYREKELTSAGAGPAGRRWHYTCAMGSYDYIGHHDGEPFNT